MIVNKDRADHWATKGFDGITDLLLDRSGQEAPITPDQLVTLSQVIRMLEDCEKVTSAPTVKSLDDFLFQGVQMLAFFLRKRTHEMGLGGLEENQRERVRTAINNLKLARERFRGLKT